MTTATRERLGHRQVLLDVLLCQQRPARSDLADQGEPVHVCRPRGLGPGLAAQLEGARLGRIALDQPGALEVCEMRVDGRRRGQPHGLAYLTHRWRIPVLVDVVREELPDLLLSAGQHSRLLGRGV